MNTAKLMTKTTKNMGLQKLMGTWSLTKLTNMHLNYSFPEDLVKWFVSSLIYSSNYLLSFFKVTEITAIHGLDQY